MNLDSSNNEVPPLRAAAAATSAGPNPSEGAKASGRSRRRPGYRYARRRRRQTPAVISLNLTAMIDTVFNLLFFFMIVSRFGAIEGLLPAQLPAKAAAAPQAAPAVDVPRTPLRIRLLPDASAPDKCRATIDELEPVPLDMSVLPKALTRIHELEGFNDSRVPVYLLASDDVAWNHVVNAYNAALAAQYERIFFAGGP